MSTIHERCDMVITRLTAARESYIALGRQCRESHHDRAATRYGKRAQLLEDTITLINEMRPDRPAILQELRRDARGELDDVVVWKVDLFRLERMDKAAWWMRLYLPDREDLVFHITGSGREVSVTVEAEER